MVFLRPVVVRSKDASNSLAMDRYEYMRAAGAMAQPEKDTILLRDLGAPLLPPLTNGQPPTGGGMAAVPPPSAPQPASQSPGQGQPNRAQPGAGTANPAAPAAPASQFRPVTPPNQK
jgi:general secretion pathway protein D